MNAPMTYAGTGVSYEDMDPFKLLCQKHARMTDDNIRRFGLKAVPWSRGESAFLIDEGAYFTGHVDEGLGTKSMAADAYDELMGTNSYGAIAQCTVAMAANDMSTVGASVISISMHLAVGSSDWFKNTRRAEALAAGWKRAADTIGAVWGCGETPTLKKMIDPGCAVLTCSAVGRTLGRYTINPENIRDGDLIYICESSGPHANAITLTRGIGEKLAQGYATRLSDGRTFGESLLAPTHLYGPLIEACARERLDVHYAVNVTGHGWRKFMRAPGRFQYLIDTLPTPHPIFATMQTEGPVEIEEMFGQCNMGAGYGIYIPPQAANTFERLVESLNLPYRVYRAGRIVDGDKSVHIIPAGISFGSETLAVR